MPSDQRRLMWILLTVAIVLACVAVASVALYLVLRGRPAGMPTSWQDPTAGVAPDKIAPDLALYPLAGASELETIDAAIANSELHTAYAALVFTLDLTDAQRSGRLLLLGRRFIEAKDPDMAELCFDQVTHIAVLSPRLNDPLRADALLGSGRGWADLGQSDRAMSAYDQAYLIALRSPYLQVAYRRELLEDVATACADLGEAEQAELCHRQIAELDQRAQPLTWDPAGEPLGLLEGRETVSSTEIGFLEEARRKAAYEVLQAFATGSEPSADQLSALAQALRAEDQAKLSLYRTELDATTLPSRRVNIEWSLARWLTLKYRVAMRGFGRSLVPEWEEQEPAIQSELSKAYEVIRFEYEDMVTALPDASLMDPGRYEVRRWLALAGQLGQYPNYPEEQIAAKLDEAARNLIAAGNVEPLYVGVQLGADEGVRFFLSPAEEYGQATPP